MEPARSFLFVPGNNEEWLRDAHTHGADVVIFDLEDSVPPSEKGLARELVSEYISKNHAEGQTVFTRINGHPRAPTRWTEQDLEAVVCNELAAVFLPKVRRPDDVNALETVLNHIERREDCTETTEVMVAIETALAVRNVYNLCSTSNRVTSMVSGAVKGTDLSQEVGFQWSGPGVESLETVHIRQKSLVDARAAGIEYPIAGAYTDIDDQDGFQMDLAFAREMGYLGCVAIHPSQVPRINEAFTPDNETIRYWQSVKDTLEEAKSAGKHVARYEGDMIDVANLSTAERYISRAKAFEDDIDIDFDE